MGDEFITFEVIPEKPVFEILGGVEMLHEARAARDQRLEQWNKAQEYIINYTLSRDQLVSPHDAREDAILDDQAYYDAIEDAGYLDSKGLRDIFDSLYEMTRPK